MTSPPRGPESVPPPYAPDAPYAQPAFSQQPKPTALPKLSNIARLLAWITIGTGALLIIASWVIVLTTASAGSLMHFTSISSALWWIPRVVGLAAIVLSIVSLARRERPVRRAVFGIIALPLVFVVDWGLRIGYTLIALVFYIAT